MSVVYMSRRGRNNNELKSIPTKLKLLIFAKQYVEALRDNLKSRFVWTTITLAAQKMKFSIKDFFIKCDQIRGKLRIWSHLMKKSLMENFIFCAVTVARISIPTLPSICNEMNLLNCSRISI